MRFAGRGRIQVGQETGYSEMTTQGDLGWGLALDNLDSCACAEIPCLFCWIPPEQQRERARRLAGLTGTAPGGQFTP
jgi:hypothetical protein